jgi:putative alpha-1,2-mannosidase
LKACVATANKRDYEGIGQYIDLGYIPAEKNGTSVSNTLEYAYDDWAIAQLAKHLDEMKFTINSSSVLKTGKTILINQPDLCVLV